MRFEKVKKKFALNNSYFKNRLPSSPETPFAVLQYYTQHNELPYSGEITENWFYECFIEYQKRAGVRNSQFFTPPATAKRMVEILSKYAKLDDPILEPCCGFGMITKELVNADFAQISAFDNAKEMVQTCIDLFEVESRYTLENFEDLKSLPFQFDYDDFTTMNERMHNKCNFIISNPPYEVKELTQFLEFVEERLYEGGYAVLLIPNGFLDKTRPANLVKILNNFKIISREKMTESFARTNIQAEIVVLQK